MVWLFTRRSEHAVAKNTDVIQTTIERRIGRANLVGEWLERLICKLQRTDLHGAEWQGYDSSSLPN